jgi:hypothetical protein
MIRKTRSVFDSKNRNSVPLFDLGFKQQLVSGVIGVFLRSRIDFSATYSS